MRTLFLIIWVIIAAQAHSQDLSPEQLKSDFALFRTALREAHPGLYRYNTREHMDSVFAETENKLNAGMTREQFFRLLTPLVAEIKCGHTKFHPDDNWTDSYFFYRDKLFPLRLIFIENKAYIIGSWLKDDYPKLQGTELKAINGTPVSEIVPLLMKGLYSDGNNLTFKYIELGKFFSALYANLIGPSDEFEISCSSAAGLEVMKLPAVSADEIYLKLAMTDKPVPWSFRLANNSAGLLTISSFADGSTKRYRQFLRETFREIANEDPGSLIIDVRNNEGGEDARGALLLSYLMNTPFRYYDHLEAVTDRKFSFSKHAYTPKFYGLLRILLTRTDSGTLLWKHHRNLKIQRPNKVHFDGNVYVLINGASFSVTSEFAAVTHYLNRAEFIGEETGGGYYGNNSGTFVIARLPNSKLNLGIPMLAYYTAVKNYPYKGHGVIPDYRITPDIDDVLKKNDIVMEFALELISKRNK